MDVGDKSAMPFGRAMLFLTLLGLMLVAAFMPSQSVRHYFQSDRTEIMSKFGTDKEIHIYQRAFLNFQGEYMRDFIGEYKSLAEAGTSTLSNEVATKWAIDRVQLLWLWGGLIAYRLEILMLWLAQALPFLIAAIADAYFTREIKKSTFVFSSPFRHHYTLLGVIGAGFLLFHWIFMPFHTSITVPPLLLVLVAVAIWVWITNLPKRV